MRVEEEVMREMEGEKVEGEMERREGRMRRV